MKIEVEVYNLDEVLYYVNNAKIEKFVPKSLKIESSYMGYSGENWGDTACGKGGWPIEIIYEDSTNGKQNWVNHKKLFKTREEVAKNLLES